jgi:hypothetical protein
MKLSEQSNNQIADMGMPLLLTGCAVLGGQEQNVKIDAVQDQVAAISTQNALLLENMNAESNPTSESTGSNSTSPTEEPTPVVIPAATKKGIINVRAHKGEGWGNPDYILAAMLRILFLNKVQMPFVTGALDDDNHYCLFHQTHSLIRRIYR